MDLFGFLCCNKPTGMTSRDVVNIIQRRVRSELNRRDIKVGHAGTLDPLAQGVLVIGVGPASRLVPYVQQQPKHYQATFRFGESTVSGDLEGDVTRYPDMQPPTLGQIDVAIAGLTGTIEQTPPAHSAIWVDGQRAYKRIRSGESFEMPSRKVEVHLLQLLRYEYPEIDIDIVCGSGTYIRSIGIDLAVAVDSVAVMSYLVRNGIGPFEIKDALTIEQLRDENLESMLLPPTLAVQHMRKIIVDDIASERLGHGKYIDEEQETAQQETGQPDRSEAAAITSEGRLRAILRWKEDRWYPYRVFPTQE